MSRWTKYATSVIGLSRGCLPELVEHGRTGWLAKSVEDLPALIQLAGKIDLGGVHPYWSARGPAGTG